jgi:hypothetical protein
MAFRAPATETTPAARPMSLGELYAWPKRNGTLGVFFAMFPQG